MKLGRFYGGYVPSRPEARGTHEPHAMRFMIDGGFSVTPDAVDNGSLLPVVLNQGGQGSCVGHAVAEALWGAMIRQRAEAGLPPAEQPSPAWCYELGRVIDGNVNQDVGTSPYSAFHGAIALGLVTESQLPYSDAVLETPDERTPALERLAFDQKIVDGLARITTTGTNRLNSIRQALAAGYLVVFGTQVDQSFEDLGPGDVWPGLTGESLGGHCLVWTGYRTVNGRVQFRTRNSWGPGWGDGGSCWMDQDAVAGCMDLWIVSSAPEWSGTVDQ